MGSYVSGLYEKEWCDGINEEVSVEEIDILVKFLHPIDHQYIFIDLKLVVSAGCK